MIIDTRYVDVDFTKEPQYVRGDNGIRPMRGPCLSYEAEAPQIPESQWPAEAEKLEGTGLDMLVKSILNQGNEGSCVSFAAAYQYMAIMAKQWGLDNVTPVSPMSVYQLIGSSPNSGSSIDDALDTTTNIGFVPLNTPENVTKFGGVVMPATGWRSPRPAGWQTVAKKFRTDERLIIQSVGGMMSALFSGHPIVVGRSGHSICYLRPVYVSGKLYMLYVNSWGNWGQAAGHHQYGFGFDSLSYIRSSANWCYAVRSIISPN